ncbi:MAG: hypothetical protein NDI63_05670 [Pseudobdellovibrio sp.]|nr:hypothetical protein [Pseudobdellovibrio sp.]
MKNLILILSICGGFFSSSLAFAGEQEAVNCKKQASLESFSKRAKKLAAEHCGKVKFSNLHLSSAPITIDKDPAVASYLTSYDCGKNKYLAVLQAIPENNCADIQYQYIKADVVK